jgi:RNA polymerase sigma factor (sigma-70 family)
MMTTQTMSPAANNDAQLVEWSLMGDRDAFRQIVERYKSLVCSITYNATGSLTLSEDIAQETFLAAWKQLAELREPSLLRAWLCGIARFLVGKELRRQDREPIHAADQLEAIHEPPSHEPSPAAQAVSREEEAILWRALQQIPDAYREPLILFYREHQSVQRVAEELELSEDAVRQRLARGRKLLHEEVIAFVEGTLTRTAPGQAFSSAVLAALPLTMGSVATTTAGATAKGSGAAKLGFWGAWLTPIIGIVGGIAAQWLVIRASPTDRERRVKKIAFTSLWVFVLGWCVFGQLAMRALGQHLNWSDQTCFSVMAGFWWIYAAVCATLTIVMFRRLLAIREQSEKAGEIHRPGMRPLKPATNAVVVGGTCLAVFSWLVWIAWQSHDPGSAAIIAGLMVGLGVWHFANLRDKIGLAGMRVVARHLALSWGMVLVILNLRLDVWLANVRRCSLAEIHSVLPVWVVPLLTLALVLWALLILALTKPSRRS